MKKILTLILISLINMEVWASTTLFSTNFSTADGWSSENIITSSLTSNTKTIKGTTISFKGYKSSNVSVSASASSGTLTFTSNNLSASAGDVADANYYMAIPVSGIVAGTVTVSFTTGSAYRPYYTYDDGNSGSVVARVQAANNNTFTITGLTNDEATIYLGTSGKTMTSLTITTPELIDLTSSTFYQTYASSNKTYAQLISAAELPSYITTNISDIDNGNSCSSLVSTPHNFSSLVSGTTYYRLKTANSINITIEALSHVKSIRLYGNGNGSSRSVTTTVTKVSGTGTAMSISSMSMANSKTTVVEYTTGDLTQKSGYDEDTYYTYTISLPGACDIWGIYIEHVPSVSCATAPTITTAPSSATYCVGNTATALSYISATATAQKWQVSTDNSEWNDISPAQTGTTYTPSTASAGTTYYRVIATCDSYTHSATSDPATITVKANHSVTAATITGTNTYGTVSAASATVCEGSTTTVTATPASGYKVTNWAVTGTGASISPSGASNSNTTTLTMGTADATVTVTFGCKAPTSPSVSGTTAYTEGDDISLTAFATGTSASVTYTWHKGATWDAASATSSIHSGATLSINDCVEGDAGTYWCNISNGTGCDVQTSKTITVSGACTDPDLTITLN